MTKNQRSFGTYKDLASATSARKAEFFEEFYADHIEFIQGSEGRGFEHLASITWQASWAASTAADCANKCESPLEISLLSYLIYIASPPPSNLCPMPQVTIDAQVQIGPYRVDFLIVTTSYEGNDIRIVADVDGHDFHEKNKEQAQRDKERDRYLTSNGFLVMRFTGSEVYRDANKCASEIRSYIEKMHYHPDDRNG